MERGLSPEREHQDWVSLSPQQARHVRELACFWGTYSPHPERDMLKSSVIAAVCGGDQSVECGIILSDTVLFDLQLMVTSLSELEGVIVLDHHLRLYSNLLDELRGTRGYAPLSV